eukprot:TRINITY_DN2535_c0_g2_i9.p3 TRINITY_DN2535_c0_g2~~TRINITY_DN2535_c0_g2_i9.p3  ORF type:complete len:105 (+),score=14.48 TRINITY_DN2535_c0_g2_i9:125-439(+)
MLDLSKHSPRDFQDASNRFKETLPSAQIIKIEKIINVHLYRIFQINTQLLTHKYNNQPIEQKLLFHGTSSNDPAVIYGGFDESFDMRLAASGMWGTGIYFAEKS